MMRTMSKACAVLFSGHNERAIVTLCRFFHTQKIPFAIVASSQVDAIFQTDWHVNVVFVRKGPTLTMAMMKEIAQVLSSRLHAPVFCPTSEFLNLFVLANRQAMTEIGWSCNLPSEDIYSLLSNKATSPACIEQLIGLKMPAEQTPGAWKAPCVLKPRRNVVDGKVLYPVLCRNDQDVAFAEKDRDPTLWFSQNWVDGQSIYLCAYLDSSGGYDNYWQLNLLQQAQGKSMVLACTSDNPGVPVDTLMHGLSKIGYVGPFMMEVIRDAEGTLYFIEVNPRFWGPLNLSLSACPALLYRFAVDAGLSPLRAPLPVTLPGPFWYAWSHGAKGNECRSYPGMPEWLSPTSLTSWLIAHDIYAQPDTLKLFNCH